MKRILALSLLPLMAACVQPTEVETGRRDFQAACVACHGPSGRGDGPMAEGLSRRPADLTHIAARHGGRFDKTQVMSFIDGFTRIGHGGVVMPAFGGVLRGPMVPYDDGTGAVPVPAHLLALANYLESIQEK